MDVEVANYNTATDPHSPFVQRCIVVRKDAVAVRQLIGREYTVRRPGHPTRSRHLSDAGPVVTNWFVGQVNRHAKATVDLIDLARTNLPADLSGGGDADEFTDRIRRADAVVLVTSEYNHGYPGALKTAIDTAYEQWFAKPVGFGPYGGSSGGLRATEQLRAVFAELHVVTMQTGVAIPDVHDAFGPDGELRHPCRPEAAAATMLRQLDWWARTLAEARQTHPYEFAGP